jgi:uncharacterized protein
MIKKISLLITVIALGIPLLFLTVLYFNQEKLLFIPTKLTPNYSFQFASPFKEYAIEVEKDVHLSGLLFTPEKPKGLVFYLHGNAGALNTWGKAAEFYLQQHHAFFVLDYRGFGKSEGTISSEKQLYADAQIAYDTLRKKYDEKDITIIGYSIGTGIAAHLAATNHPKQLILKAPYYNMGDLVESLYGVNPGVLLKYPLATNEFLPKITAPITLFHGDSDRLIYHGSSEKLSKLLKKNDRFITLIGQEHNGISDNWQYREAVADLLK